MLYEDTYTRLVKRDSFKKLLRAIIGKLTKIINIRCRQLCNMTLVLVSLNVNVEQKQRDLKLYFQR